MTPEQASFKMNARIIAESLKTHPADLWVGDLKGLLLFHDAVFSALGDFPGSRRDDLWAEYDLRFLEDNGS